MLEAPVVVVGGSSAIGANGGGGRGGCANNGADGLAAVLQAAGGSCSADSSYNGGRGGSLELPASAGGDGVSGGFHVTDWGAGAGGGGVGRIRINTRLNGLEIEPGAVISPAPSLGGIALR